MIYCFCHSISGEFENSELLKLLECPDDLENRVNEAIDVLNTKGQLEMPAAIQIELEARDGVRKVLFRKVDDESVNSKRKVDDESINLSRKMDRSSKKTSIRGKKDRKVMDCETNACCMNFHTTVSKTKKCWTHSIDL